MEQTHQVVAVGHLFQQLHGELVVVAGGVGVGVYRGQLVLGGGGLVVLRLGQHAHLPQLPVQLVHKRCHPGLNGAVVVVVQLLTLGGHGAEQRPAAQHQILPLPVVLFVNEEILLLRAHLGGDVLHRLVAEQAQNPDALVIQHRHGPQQRRLFIQCFAAVRAENGGDIQGVVLNKGVAAGVPGGVAPGLKGGPQPAGGEGGGVGLAPGQLLGGQLHDDAAASVGHDKAVVLLGGEAGHGLEPVGVVGGPHLNGPVLHSPGDLHRQLLVQRPALAEALLPGGKGGCAEPLSHLVLRENHTAEQCGYSVGALAHCAYLLFRNFGANRRFNP